MQHDQQQGKKGKKGKKNTAQAQASAATETAPTTQPELQSDEVVHALIIDSVRIQVQIEAGKAEVEHLHEEKVGKIKTALSDRIIRMAQEYCDESGAFNVAAFETRCKAEEDWIKSDAAAAYNVKVDRVPRHWTQVKSEVVRFAKDFGGSPANQTFYTLHDALNEKRKERKKAEEQATATGDKEISVNVAGMEHMDPEIAKRAVHLVKLYGQAKTGKTREEMLAELDSMADYFQGLLDAEAGSENMIPDEAPSLSEQDEADLRALAQEQARLQ